QTPLPCTQVHRHPPLPFKGMGIFEIPLPDCSAGTAHITSSQLTTAAPCSKRSPTWSTPELLDLLVLQGEEALQSQLHSSHRNSDTYRQISHGFLGKGYEWDTHQCHAKIKELRQAYQKAKEANCCSGAAPKTCHFYKELDTILGSELTSTAKTPVATLAGLE
ncbi:zinc finger and SCAN domain containing 20, partial [Chelydra serpentina]